MTVDTGPNTFWLDVHGLLIFTLVLASFLFGAIYFTTRPDRKHVRRLKVTGAVVFALLILVMITGMIPDVNFGMGSTFTRATQTDFGTVQTNVTDDQLAAFTGPLLFDMMEHVSLVVPGLAAVVGFLIWHYGERTMSDPHVKRSVLALMLVTGAWYAVMGAIGAFITKVLTFPTESMIPLSTIIPSEGARTSKGVKEPVPTSSGKADRAAAAALLAGTVYVWLEAAFRLIFTYTTLSTTYVLWDGRVGDIAAMWLTMTVVSVVAFFVVRYGVFRRRQVVGSLWAWTWILIVSAIIAPLIGEIGTPIGI